MATFMDIAAETRMQIYEEMFVPRGQFWLRSYQGNHERGQYLKVAYSEYGFNTAILRVCNKVYHEAIEVFIRQNTFNHLINPEAFSVYYRFPKPQSSVLKPFFRQAYLIPPCLDTIKNLHIAVDITDFKEFMDLAVRQFASEIHQEVMRVEMQRACTVMDNMPALKSVKISMHGGGFLSIRESRWQSYREIEDRYSQEETTDDIAAFFFAVFEPLRYLRRDTVVVQGFVTIVTFLDEVEWVVEQAISDVIESRLVLDWDAVWNFVRDWQCERVEAAVSKGKRKELQHVDWKKGLEFFDFGKDWYAALNLEWVWRCESVIDDILEGYEIADW
ncbi:MAG: hypothetical protein ASARMPREDX12_002485 [Alectoria sarmentosa]|nr:MAG: hypothetical protein ASARMPREDX12_002485 [Alectoria sarmentosa]